MAKGLTEPVDPDVLAVEHVVDGLFVRECRPVGRVVFEVPVLFLHGGMHGWWTWQRWQRIFAHAGWQNFAMSLPGHTDSRPLAVDDFRGLRLIDYCVALERVADWVGDLVVVAHSMGGLVAQVSAQHRNFAALVLVAPIGPGSTPVRADLPEDRLFSIEPDAARSLFFHDVDDGTFGEFSALLGPESARALNDYTRGGVVTGDPPDCPVLVLEAEFDREVLARQAREAAAFHGAELVRVLGAGHDLMLEAGAAEAANQVCHWLAQNVPTAARPSSAGP